jgi:hypothetical protein
MYNLNFEWLNEEIETFPKYNGMYKLLCLMLLKKKLTYSNLYVLSYKLNKNKFKNNENVLKGQILKDLAYLYFFNNKKLPDGFEM